MKEREEKKISSIRMRSRNMLKESAIAAKGRDAEQTSSSEVFIIIVTLLQLYDETTRNPQHQRTKHFPNSSNNGHHPTKQMAKKWTSIKMTP